MYRNDPESQTSDEVILVQRAVGHDANAFGKLYDLHADEQIHGSQPVTKWPWSHYNNRRKPIQCTSEARMIKGIVGCKARNGEDVRPLLLKLGSHAMQYPGCMSVENFVSDVDSSVVIVISTWETIESWRLWVTSRITQDLLRQAEALQQAKSRITAYRIIPAAEWR
ncbi:MAG: antibiotic biosynthesis monooxygenase [Dehalococcoidia bacterium]